jgi:uncharacterized repeat protein (TIGR01451 family)
MAGPHVAGLVALLISAYPELSGHVDRIESTVEQNALQIPWTGCNSSGVPNNAYGWGRIDALATVESAHRIELKKVASAASVTPGDLITYTLTITHSLGNSPTTNVVLTDTLPVGTTFISATSPFTQTGDTIQWGFPTLDVIDARSVDLSVRVDITATGMITNEDYAVQSDQVAPVRGAPVTTPVEELNLLALHKDASALIVMPGDLITYTLTITDVHETIPATNLVLTDTLPVGTTFISATSPYTLTGDIARWEFPSLDAQGSLNVIMVVRVDVAASGVLTNFDYGVSSDQVAFLQGAPVTTRVGNAYFLPLAVNSP